MMKRYTDPKTVINKQKPPPMPLTVDEIRKILTKEPVNKRRIPDAVEHENRLRVHCELNLSLAELRGPITRLLDRVKAMLPPDKYEMFLASIAFPIGTVTLTDRIFTALQKVFDGRNPVYKYEFTVPEFAQDWEQYRNRTLRANVTWKTTGFEVMKTAINSIVIVDLPAEQKDRLPEPYFYFLSVSNVIDFSCPEGTVFEWLIFRQEQDRIAVFDDASFRVFAAEGNEIVGEPLVESPHELGYCPARWFWTTRVKTSDPVIKRSPLTSQLGRLDNLFIFEGGNEHLNMYARWPIYSVLASDCDFSHEPTGAFCDGGFLRGRDNLYLMEGDGLKPCPVCSGNRFVGPGTLLEYDAPGRQNDGSDLSNPVQITGIPKETLEYNVNDLSRRELQIYEAVTGFQGMPINDQAVNEKQVVAIFETLEAALAMPQRNFEQAITWTDATLARLRYGVATFVKASISLGTEHFLLLPSQIMGLYGTAKETSTNFGILDFLEDLYFETEFRNNPEEVYRNKVLNNLDPFRHRSTDDVLKMYEAQQIEFADYMIKANFSSLIARFERENVPVTEFGLGVSFDARINAIYSALRVYADQFRPVALPAE